MQYTIKRSLNASRISIRPKIGWAAGIFLVFTFLVSCKPSNPYSYTFISGDTIINADMTEIQFREPFKPVKQVNKLCFNYSDETTISNVDTLPKFTDGKEMKVSATLVDNLNSSTLLDEIGENGPQYLCLVPSRYEEWLDISKRDTRFLKLIVSSSRPVHIRKIEWKAYNSWDFK